MIANNTNIIISAIMYIVISLSVVIFDMYTAYNAYKEQKKNSVILAVTCVLAAVVQITYLLSIFAGTYIVASLFFSLYFITIDFTVLSLLVFVRAHTTSRFSKQSKWLKKVLLTVLFVDVSILIINIFWEISVYYVEQGYLIGRYAFAMKPLYSLHLGYTYMMVLMVVIRFFQTAISMPVEYRRPIFLSISSIIVVVAINGLFLFYPSVFGENNLDYSLWGYSLAAFLIYYLCYRYPMSGMKSYYNEWIVHNVNQGVVLFNYEENLIIFNEKMHQIFPASDIHEGMTIEEFSQGLNLGVNEERSDEDYSFQHYVEREGKEIAIRFDHRCLRGKKQDRLGQLFVFTDETGDIDLLTSFFNWNYFKREFMENPGHFRMPVTVAVCDLNGLHDINYKFGKNVGDHAIEALAIAIRKHFTREACFIRGEEANLIVLSFELDEQTAAEHMEAIRNELLHNNELGCLLFIQFAVGTVKQNDDLLAVIDQELQSMRNKKLLDEQSYHSEIVNSLVNTLMECDPDTVAHVKRTQILGEGLGRRLGLSDKEQSDLALLCVLHDIGKIGIPLEILNKPGKLTDPEWRTMKSHVDKGYQIANSSRELSHIADMILHHHEFWNGKGYPDGLTRESIPLLSRVISVVDAYDAMVTKRPYRNAVSRDDAMKELRKFAGTQFDPRIVNEFLLLLNEMDSNEMPEKLDESSSGMERFITRSLAESQKNLQESIHEVLFSRYILEDQWRIIQIDDQFEKITGYSAEEAQNMELIQLDLLPEEDRTEYLRTVLEQKSRNDMILLEHRLKKKDGSIIFVFCYGKSYYDSADKTERSEIIIFDGSYSHALQFMMQTELKKAEARLAKWEDKYRCDSLTGLLNHEAYKNDIELILLKTNQKIMLLMLDVDRFKEYNDVHGHRSGDEFLIRIAQHMRSVLGEKDLACRMGGDEFSLALIYEPETSVEIMEQRAEQICTSLNGVVIEEIGGAGISMGLVISDAESKTFNVLYEHADQALYKSKEEGGGRLISYYPGICR